MIVAHPNDYTPGDGWQNNVTRAMEGVVPHAFRGLLDKLFIPNLDIEKSVDKEAEKAGGEQSDQRHGGW